MFDHMHALKRNTNLQYVYKPSWFCSLSSSRVVRHFSKWCSTLIKRTFFKQDKFRHKRHVPENVGEYCPYMVNVTLKGQLSHLGHFHKKGFAACDFYIQIIRNMDRNKVKKILLHTRLLSWVQYDRNPEKKTAPWTSQLPSIFLTITCVCVHIGGDHVDSDQRVGIKIIKHQPCSAEPTPAGAKEPPPLTPMQFSNSDSLFVG